MLTKLSVLIEEGGNVDFRCRPEAEVSAVVSQSNRDIIPMAEAGGGFNFANTKINQSSHLHLQRKLALCDILF